MKEQVQRILMRYSPPLSEANIDEIIEAIMTMVAAEQKRRFETAAQKKKESKASDKAKKRSSATK